MCLKNRLLEMINGEGINPNKFYQKTRLGNGFLDKVGIKLKNPSIEKISAAFPNWNIDYLQTGEGFRYLYKDGDVKIFDFNHFLSSNNLSIENIVSDLNPIFDKKYIQSIVDGNPVSLNLYNELVEKYGFDVVYNSTYNAHRSEREIKQKSIEIHDENKITEKHIEQNSSNTIPLLPISAQAGTLNDFIVSVKDNDTERIISPIKGADFAITVTGDSMAPEYPNGSQILIKKINENSFIVWGNVYVLDTCNGTVIKKIFPTDTPDRVMCISINSEYPSFEVSLKNDVYGVYRVLLCMSLK